MILRRVSFASAPGKSGIVTECGANDNNALSDAKRRDDAKRTKQMHLKGGGRSEIIKNLFAIVPRLSALSEQLTSRSLEAKNEWKM